MPRAPVARTGILLICGKYLHGSIISCREEVWAHKNSITTPFLLKCMYQARKVGGHVYLYVKVCNFRYASRSYFVYASCDFMCPFGVLFYVSQMYLSMRIVILCVSPGLILFIPIVFCISGHSILYEYQVTLIVFSIYFCLQIKY